MKNLERKQQGTRRLTWLIDVLTLPLAGVVAAACHDQLRLAGVDLKPRAPVSEYVIVLYATVPLWLLLVSWLRLDRVFERRWTPLQLTRDLLVLHALGFLGLASVLYLSQAIMNRMLLGLFLAANFVFSFAARMALTRWFQRQYLRGLLRPAWVLVGTPGPRLQRFVSALEADAFPPQLVGLLGDRADASPGLPLAHLGAPEALPRVLHEHAVDLVVFFPPHHQGVTSEALLHACEQVGTPAAFAVDHGQRYAFRPTLEMVGSTPLLSFDWVPPRELSLSIKHLIDPLLAGLALVLLTPVLVAAAAAVRLSMGGPLLFRQERVGLHGRRFTMWKFRSMVNDAEAQKGALQARNEMSGPVFKVTDDPRVTPVGRFIRKWSIDELPQLLNVLVGDMSLVGPRPLPLGEQQRIEGWYRRRLSMKPGITGLWQVSGRSGIDFDQWMQLDLKYVDEWSLLLDLKLLVLTIPAVLAKRGAK